MRWLVQEALIKLCKWKLKKSEQCSQGNSISPSRIKQKLRIKLKWCKIVNVLYKYFCVCFCLCVGVLLDMCICVCIIAYGGQNVKWQVAVRYVTRVLGSKRRSAGRAASTVNCQPISPTKK